MNKVKIHSLKAAILTKKSTKETKLLRRDLIGKNVNTLKK